MHIIRNHAAYTYAFECGKSSTLKTNCLKTVYSIQNYISQRITGCDIALKCLNWPITAFIRTVFSLRRKAAVMSVGLIKNHVSGFLPLSEGWMPARGIIVTIRLMLNLGVGTLCLGLEVCKEIYANQCSCINSETWKVTMDIGHGVSQKNWTQRCLQQERTDVWDLSVTSESNLVNRFNLTLHKYVTWSSLRIM